MNVPWPHWWQVNIGSGNGLLRDGTNGDTNLCHHMASLGPNELAESILPINIMNWLCRIDGNFNVINMKPCMIIIFQFIASISMTWGISSLWTKIQVGSLFNQGPFYYHSLTLTPEWISTHIPNKVSDKITYPFLNFNVVSSFIPHFIMDVITYPYWD